MSSFEGRFSVDPTLIEKAGVLDCTYLGREVRRVVWRGGERGEGGVIRENT